MLVQGRHFGTSHLCHKPHSTMASSSSDHVTPPRVEDAANETRGNGDVDTRGDGDVSTRGDGDDRSSVASLPSYAETNGSTFSTRPGAESIEITPTPGTEDPKGWMFDGPWDDTPDAIPTTKYPGTFGIICGNWGGHRAERALQAHMDFDLKSGPCHIMILQEADVDLLNHLRSPGTAPLDRHTRGGGEPSPDAASGAEGEIRGGGGPSGGAADGLQEEGAGDTTRGGGDARLTYQYFGVRGLEDGTSTMICGRRGLVKAMRMRYFHLRNDGPYHKNRGGRAWLRAEYSWWRGK